MNVVQLTLRARITGLVNYRVTYLRRPNNPTLLPQLQGKAVIYDESTSP
jgi:hypothetical protein